MQEPRSIRPPGACMFVPLADGSLDVEMTGDDGTTYTAHLDTADPDNYQVLESAGRLMVALALHVARITMRAEMHDPSDN